MSRKNDAGGRPTWTDPDDAPELTEEFFERGEVRHGDRIVRRGRPPTGNAKALVSLRLDQDVLQRLRALGAGWQTRANEALRAFLDREAGESSP